VDHIEGAVGDQELVVLAVPHRHVLVVGVNEEHVEDVVAELDAHPHALGGQRAVGHIRQSVHQTDEHDDEAEAAVVQLLLLDPVDLVPPLLVPQVLNRQLLVRGA